MNRTLQHAMLVILYCLLSGAAFSQDFHRELCTAVTSVFLEDVNSTSPIRFVSTDVEAGSSLDFAWEVPENNSRNDEYLIVGFPEATRFKGDGFVAVSPRARAPQSLMAQRDKTRFIVPITKDIAITKGAAAVFFYSEGPKKIYWQKPA